MIVPCKLIKEHEDGTKVYEFELERFVGSIILTKNSFHFNGHYGNYGFSQSYSQGNAITLEDLKISFEGFIKFFYRNKLVAGTITSNFLPTGAEFTFVDEDLYNSPLYQALL